MVETSEIFSKGGENLQDKIEQKRRKFYFRGKISAKMHENLQISDLVREILLRKSEDSEKFESFAINKNQIQIWISSKGCVTPLHYDKCHGILIQLYGEKRFTVYPPQEFGNLYLMENFSGPKHCCKVPWMDKFWNEPHQMRFEEVQLLWRRFSKSFQAQPFCVTLRPGSFFYTPPGFFHEVTSLTFSVSLTVPFDMNFEEIQKVPTFMGL
eukprot:Sdes_comp16277_c0_seq2m5587